jgi:hypothetical protein
MKYRMFSGGKRMDGDLKGLGIISFQRGPQAEV